MGCAKPDSLTTARPTIKTLASNGLGKMANVGHLPFLFILTASLIVSLFISHLYIKFYGTAVRRLLLRVDSIRILWYEDLESTQQSEVYFLEFKHKVGEQRFKRRLLVGNEFSNIPLESSHFNAVLDELRTFRGKVLEQVFPVFIVKFYRHRFILPGTDLRLCIDSNISVPRTNLHLLKRRPSASYLNECVFELKGPSRKLPQELTFLEKPGAKKQSFSKYERCYDQLIAKPAA